MRAEASCNLTRDEFRETYALAGFALREWFADERGGYALSPAERF